MTSPRVKSLINCSCTRNHGTGHTPSCPGPPHTCAHTAAGQAAEQSQVSGNSHNENVSMYKTLNQNAGGIILYYRRCNLKLIYNRTFNETSVPRLCSTSAPAPRPAGSRHGLCVCTDPTVFQPHRDPQKPLPLSQGPRGLQGIQSRRTDPQR